MKLGVIGLGIMGLQMARHLIAAGHEVHLKTRRDIPADLLDLCSATDGCGIWSNPTSLRP